jgi:hypothetical protein
MEKMEQRMKFYRLKESRAKSKESGKFEFLILCSLFIIPALMSPSCKPKTEATSETTTTSTIAKPVFSADSAYVYTQHQVDFGPRVPGTSAQQKCAAYFEEKLKQFGATVYMQKTNVVVYNGKSVPCINVIGAINPEAKRRLLICTHWDSRPFADQDDSATSKPIMAADDGASGSAVLLEIARKLQQKNPQIGVDLIFLDVEDYGQPEYDLNKKQGDFYCLGTQYWCKNPHVPNYKAENGILLDMVGAKGATFTIEGVSMQYAPAFNKQVWKYAAQLGWSNFFLNDVTDQIIDDHYYINEMAKIPTIDIIYRSYNTRSGFAPHWHTHDDNMSIIDKTTLQAVGETVMATIYDF